MKTAARMSAMAMTDPKLPLHRLDGGIVRTQPVFDIVFDRLHDDK